MLTATAFGDVKLERGWKKGGLDHGERTGRERAPGTRTLLRRILRATFDEPQDQLQALLDEKDAREWHLVGVVGGLSEGGTTFFWDTERPSFGRSSH